VVADPPRMSVAFLDRPAGDDLRKGKPINTKNQSSRDLLGRPSARGTSKKKKGRESRKRGLKRVKKTTTQKRCRQRSVSGKRRFVLLMRRLSSHEWGWRQEKACAQRGREEKETRKRTDRRLSAPVASIASGELRRESVRRGQKTTEKGVYI